MSRKPIWMVAALAAASMAVGCPSSNGGGGNGTPTAAENGGDDTNGSNGSMEGKFGTASITGTVKFTGTAPKRTPLRRNADPVCAKTKMDSESVIVEDGKLHNVVVRVVDGVEGTYDKGEPIEIDQEECMYRPRVSVSMNGAMVKIVNSDETLHNVHVYKGKATEFNKAMPPNSEPIEQKFSDGGEVFKFKCDVHPWMEGYLATSDHPFNAVAEDGTFTISKLPAGTYKVEAWHEKYGTKSMEVTVADGATETIEFEYSGTETAMK